LLDAAQSTNQLSLRTIHIEFCPMPDQRPRGSHRPPFCKGPLASAPALLGFCAGAGQSEFTGDSRSIRTWLSHRCAFCALRAEANVGKGSTAVHPVSSGNRQQWVESPDSFWTIVTIAAWLHGEVNVDFHRCDRGNAQGTESLQTPRWREVDSNSRSRWRTLQSKDISGSVRVYGSAAVFVER
jgi:hypothetical protein